MKTKLRKLWYTIELIGFIGIFLTFFLTKSEFMMIKMGILIIMLMLTVSKVDEE